MNNMLNRAIERSYLEDDFISYRRGQSVFAFGY